MSIKCDENETEKLKMGKEQQQSGQETCDFNERILAGFGISAVRSEKKKIAEMAEPCAIPA